jgi:hypothetical protein
MNRRGVEINRAGIWKERAVIVRVMRVMRER